MVLYTIGHSTHTLDEFMALLGAHGITAIADVRRFPASRRHPHFGRERLQEALAAHGVAYVWMEALGGRRRARADSPHTAWTNEAFRAYADHMETPEFGAALADLLGGARTQVTAVVCAEAVPWRCHRQIIADALVAQGHQVRHVLGIESARAHQLTAFARVDGARIRYDGGQLALGGPRR
jgi:uncharacterized protein (DUF488 family)